MKFYLYSRCYLQSIKNHHQDKIYVYPRSNLILKENFAEPAEYCDQIFSERFEEVGRTANPAALKDLRAVEYNASPSFSIEIQ
jgi:hypothetical protein